MQYVHCLKEMDEQEIGREYLAAAAKMLEKCQAVSPQTRAKRQSGLIRKEAKKENIVLLIFKNIFPHAIYAYILSGI